MKTLIWFTFGIFFVGNLVVPNVASANVEGSGWLVKSKNTKYEFTLYESGKIERTNQNCAHGKSENCHSYAIDLSTSTIRAQGGSNYTDNFFVTFESPDSNPPAEQISIQVFFNLEAGDEPTKVVQRTISGVTGSLTVEEVDLTTVNVPNYNDLEFPDDLQKVVV